MLTYMQWSHQMQENVKHLCGREKKREKHKLALVYIFKLHTNKLQHIQTVQHYITYSFYNIKMTCKWRPWYLGHILGRMFLQDMNRTEHWMKEKKKGECP